MQQGKLGMQFREDRLQDRRGSVNAAGDRGEEVGVKGRTARPKRVSSWLGLEHAPGENASEIRKQGGLWFIKELVHAVGNKRRSGRRIDVNPVVVGGHAVAIVVACQ